MCAKSFKPRDKGSVEQNLRKGRGPETNGVSLSPFFQLLGVLRVKELSRTDMKANDTALNLLVCPSVPVRLSKHLLGFLETTETTNQHYGLSGPLPSHLAKQKLTLLWLPLKCPQDEMVTRGATAYH